MSISIHELLAVAKESEGVKAVQGDDMLCEKRFAPDTRYGEKALNRRKIIEEGWSMARPSGAMPLPSANVTGTSGTPRISF